jgi:hypothetical protein
MRRTLQNPMLLTIATLLVVVISIRSDIGATSWMWSQRSGAVVVLTGALLGYRSIIRLGKQGVGGASLHWGKGTILSVDDSGPVQMLKTKLDAETAERLRQDELDKARAMLAS